VNGAGSLMRIPQNATVMKNKGSRHISGVDSRSGSMNCKGCLTHMTRPIESMSSNGNAGWSGNSARFDKKKWSKRVRGYLKSQTKDLYSEN